MVGQRKSPGFCCNRVVSIFRAGALLIDDGVFDANYLI